MQVIATAGHVDHGKSALVRALTGMEPDRWAEERRRGLTLDLGFAWLTLPGGQRLAFVDVPGHERFVPNMLAGVGPVPAVLFVVAADGGWMPQSAEHLAAIDAVGIRHGLLAVTRADLADPGPVRRQALDRLAASSLGRVEAVAVSSVTGDGLSELRAALVRLVASLPAPDAAAPVRLWIDRSFSIKGSGTVVTGTLPAGTITAGQEFLLTPSMRAARIRGLESLNEPAAAVTGVARVAVNLRGIPSGVPARGMALVEEGRWTLTKLIDVRLSPPALSSAALPRADVSAPDLSAADLSAAALSPGLRLRAPDRIRLPQEAALHIGSARTLVRIRPLGSVGADGAVIARLTLRDGLPLHVGDRVLLRDPGRADLAIWGAMVLDVAPPALARRGAATAAGRELAAWPDPPAAADLLRRHGLLQARVLAAMGVPGGPPPVAGEWLADPVLVAGLRRKLIELVAAYVRREPLAVGMPPEAARAALGLPDRSLVEALVRVPAGLSADTSGSPQADTSGSPQADTSGSPQAAVQLTDGYLQLVPLESLQHQESLQRHGFPRFEEPSGSRPRESAHSLPPRVVASARAVLADLAGAPFMAPDAGRLRDLGLDPRAIAAAARAGLLLRVNEQIVLAPGAQAEAARVLGALPQPFTTAEARQALATTRRVAIPLLEYLDRAGITQRLPDDRRRVR
jgi:selenocysteine-specific elongation factor